MAKARKKSSWVKWLLYSLLLIAIVVVCMENKKYFRRAYRYFTHRYYKTNFKPTDFPENYSVHGIDISHYQDVIDWKKLWTVDTKGDTIRFQFVYIKATQGIFIEDEQFDENWDDAKDHNITRGAYHYFLADRSPQLQAENFITSVTLKPGDLPPAVDIEEDRGQSKEQVVIALKEYIASIELHYGVKPIIYSNINFIEDYLADDFKDYQFWVSHFYEDNLAVEDSLNWYFWQHSDKADLLGITGKADADVFNGTKTDFDKILVK